MVQNGKANCQHNNSQYGEKVMFFEHKQGKQDDRPVFALAGPVGFGTNWFQTLS
jgi:hypothetical protein